MMTWKGEGSPRNGHTPPPVRAPRIHLHLSMCVIGVLFHGGNMVTSPRHCASLLSLGRRRTERRTTLFDYFELEN